jgi:DNA-binding NarL/FixJ family response regulator
MDFPSLRKHHLWRYWLFFQRGAWTVELAAYGVKGQIQPGAIAHLGRIVDARLIAANGREALVLCRRLRPDLALIDVRMPDLDGLATTRAIKQECPDTSVIIVTIYQNPDYLLDALKAGAAGYVLKEATRRELLTTVRRVLQGESVLNGDVAASLIKRLIDEMSHPAALPAEQLTAREHEVLELLAQGHTNREIAHQLSVSVGTVKVHVEHIIGKLNVTDRTQAAVRAVSLGLLQGVAE